MPGTGWGNPFPLKFGGGKSRTRLAYESLRASVGEGGCTDEEGTLENMWRAARARAIAAAASTVERAFVQAFPSRATDLLPYYEQALGLVPDPALTESERNAVVAPLWNAHNDASDPSLELQLQAIDSRFSLLVVPPEQSLVTMMGRGFEPFDGSEPMGLAGPGSEYPAANSHDQLTALLPLGAGVVPDAPTQQLMQSAAQLLGNVGPAWAGVRVLTHVGFNLDGDILDGTGFGS